MSQYTKSVIERFKQNPYHYFTENDLVIDIVTELKNNLRNRLQCKDKEGVSHSIVHTEYSTPFRCDMANDQFIIKDDADRTVKGRKYKRGRYDIVVLNKEYIEDNSIETIQGQNYEMLKMAIRNKRSIFDYAIEVMFVRDEIKWSRGDNPEKGLTNIIQKVEQDWKKLFETKQKGLLKDFEFLFFIRNTKQEIIEKMRSKLNKNQNINIIND